jgi:hypothetical protein
MKEIVSTLIRNILKACGPLLAAKGWIDEANLELIGGAVATLVGVVWGLVDAKEAAKAKRQYKAGQAGDFSRSSQTNL